VSQLLFNKCVRVLKSCQNSDSNMKLTLNKMHFYNFATFLSIGLWNSFIKSFVTYHEMSFLKIDSKFFFIKNTYLESSQNVNLLANGCPHEKTVNPAVP
jgi:hypothetical protein